jgi:Flavin reductase like domain
MLIRLKADQVEHKIGTAFVPPLLVVGEDRLRHLSDGESSADVRAEHVGQGSKKSSLHILQTGRRQRWQACGQSFRKGTTDAPILIDVPGAVECRVITVVEQGDHHIVVGE